MGRVAAGIIAASALVAAGVLGLALVGLQSRVSLAQLLVYLLLPAAYLLVAGAALRAKAETRVGFALALVSVGFATVASELAASAWLGLQARASMRPTLRAHLTEFRGSGVESYPRIPGNQVVDLDPKFAIGGELKHPISPGPAATTILHCDEDRPMLTYRSDRFGFDNPDSVWNAAATQIAVLGDSYTIGVCVSPDEAIPGRLRAHGTLLNLGMSGSGPLQELALLREFVAPRRPAIVVWIFYEGNDFYDLGREAQREWLREYLNAGHSQRLAEQFAPLDSAYRLWIDSLFAAEPAVRPVPPLWTISDVVRLTSVRRLVPAAVSRPRPGSKVGILPEVLSRARADVEAWGGRFVVAYMPAYRRYGVLLGDPYPERAAVLERLKELGIETVDLHEAFVATGNPRALWVTPRSHLTAEGYGVAAHAIEKALDLRTSSRP
jgi:lysophospholipase L1-like esterase